jgi:methyltransferase (TIGR00027 family)
VPGLNTNIIRTGRPSATALSVAVLRAAHQLLDEPLLLDDPLALLIIGQQAATQLREDPYAYNDPIRRFLRAALVVRSTFAEEELDRAVAAGVRQYVVLGAGLDTFAYRNPHSAQGFKVFEVDHPSTQAWKRGMLANAGIGLPDNLTFAPVDFEAGTLADGLVAAGFRLEQPACISWLGVTMYLSDEAIFDTLRFVAGLPRGSSICFDFIADATAANPLRLAVTHMLSQAAAAKGEPWIADFVPAALRERVLALGFAEVDTFDADQLNRQYLYRRKDGLRTLGQLLRARK